MLITLTLPTEYLKENTTSGAQDDSFLTIMLHIGAVFMLQREEDIRLAWGLCP